MKQLLLFAVIFFCVSLISNAQQQSDTTITIKMVYHLQPVDGVQVDSIVEMKITKKKPIPPPQVKYIGQGNYRTK